MKKTYIFLIAIFGIALVAGAWYFTISGDLNVLVDSIGGTNTKSLVFPEMKINTTDGADSSGSQIEFIYNKRGNFSVSIIETFADTSSGLCSGGDNDCETNSYLSDGSSTIYQIHNGQSLIIPENTNKKIVSVNMTCVAYACPQERSVRVTLTEQSEQ